MFLFFTKPLIFSEAERGEAFVSKAASSRTAKPGSTSSTYNITSLLSSFFFTYFQKILISKQVFYDLVSQVCVRSFSSQSSSPPSGSSGTAASQRMKH
jgi:hypothetical protein